MKVVPVILWATLASSALPATTPPPDPMALVVHFDYEPRDHAALRGLERRLDQALRRAGTGRRGESELHADGNDGYLYFEGPDALRLYRSVRGVLGASRLMRGAELRLRGAAGTTGF